MNTHSSVAGLATFRKTPTPIPVPDPLATPNPSPDMIDSVPVVTVTERAA